MKDFAHKLPSNLKVTDLKSFHKFRDILDCRYYAGKSIGNVSESLYKEYMQVAEEVYDYLVGGDDELRKIMVTGFF